MQSRSASSVATHSRTESTRTNVMRGAEHASTDPFSLVGRFAVVTGGTKGLGEAIVEALCERGCRVFTCARTRSDVEERVRSWRTRGYDVDGCACDVSDAKARKTLVEAVRKWSNGTLHALVNNVGFNTRKPTLEYTSSEYAALMGTNLEASFEFCKEFHGMLRASGSGAIVFNSSVSGLTSTATGSLYAMSKGAMNQLTRYLACEWAKDNIRVNAVAPWYIATPLAKQVLKNETYRRAVVDRTPAGRVGEPPEVGAVAAFLVAPASSYVTGVVIPIDGGFTAHGFIPPKL